MSKNGLTREENRKAWLYAFLIVLGMGAVAALLVWSRSWNMTSVELRETNPLVTEAARGLDEITVDASFDPVARTLAVEQRMTLYNRTGETPAPGGGAQLDRGIPGGRDQPLHHQRAVLELLPRGL